MANDAASVSPASESPAAPVGSSPRSSGPTDDGVEIDLRFGETVVDLRLPAAATDRRRFAPRAKRGVDLGVSLAALTVGAVPMAVLAVLVGVTSQGGVLYRQTRVGRDGEHFECLKFRTMNSNAALDLETLLADDPELAAEFARDFKLRRDPRITRLGTLLRRTSLDELPQLLNVVRGHMSVIGPRPLQPHETDRYGNAIELVLRVRPGMTGLWQVSGRNDLPYRERVQLDMAYATSWTLLGDLGILLRTIPALLLPGRNGAY